MKPTIGRIVIYHTCAMDQRMINEHPLNTPQEQSPAIVVFVGEDDTVNLKVFLDGHGDFYKKNIKRGDQPGEWNWPVIESKGISEFRLNEIYTPAQEILNFGQQQGESGILTANVEHPVSESLAKKLDQFSENKTADLPETINNTPNPNPRISEFLSNTIFDISAKIEARKSDNKGLPGITGPKGVEGPAGMPQIEIMGSDGPTILEGNPNVQITVADDIDQQHEVVNVPVFDANKEEVPTKTKKK